MNDYKTLIRELFGHVFESPQYSENTVRKYFSEDYIQHVDGKTLQFGQLLEHIKVLKREVPEMLVHFDTLAQEDHIVFSNHTVYAIKRDGSKGTIQVIAEFHIKDGKVNYCNELTRLISGNASDRDLGSRH